HRSFFMAGAVDGKKDLRLACDGEDPFAESKWKNRIVRAVDNQHRNANSLDFSFRVQLPVDKQAKARQKRKSAFGNFGGGREGAFENQRGNSAPGSQVCGDAAAQGLTEGDDGVGSQMLHVDEVLVARVCIAIDAGLTRSALAVPVAAVLDSENVAGRRMQEAVCFSSIGNVAGVAVESEEGELRLWIWDPPSVKFDAVGRMEPNILNREASRVPITIQAAGVIGKENEARFESANHEQ